uniref:Uncharacterized protein n=1 Tax=Anguilla anguilla TaxID=7936 RepID=A0A0E9WJI7_ANGAN
MTLSPLFPSLFLTAASDGISSSVELGSAQHGVPSNLPPVHPRDMFTCSFHLLID